MVTGEGSVQGAVEEKDTAVRWGTVVEVGKRGDLEERRTDPKRVHRGVESRERRRGGQRLMRLEKQQEPLRKGILGKPH